MKEYYVSIKGSLGFTIKAEEIIYKNTYYTLVDDINVCFQTNKKTICRIPKRIIEEIKISHILEESEIIYKAK